MNEEKEMTTQEIYDTWLVSTRRNEWADFYIIDEPHYISAEFFNFLTKWFDTSR